MGPFTNAYGAGGGGGGSEALCSWQKVLQWNLIWGREKKNADMREQRQHLHFSTHTTLRKYEDTVGPADANLNRGMHIYCSPAAGVRRAKREAPLLKCQRDRALEEGV